MSVHASSDGGETSVCGKTKAEMPFEYTLPGELQTGEFAGEPCGRCLTLLAERVQTYVGANPDHLQSVTLRAFDATGRELLNFQINTREYEIELVSATGYDEEKKRSTIGFRLKAVARK